MGDETTDFTDNTDGVRELRMARKTWKEDGFTEGNEGERRGLMGDETTDGTDKLLRSGPSRSFVVFCSVFLSDEG